MIEFDVPKNAKRIIVRDLCWDAVLIECGAHGLGSVVTWSYGQWLACPECAERAGGNADENVRPRCMDYCLPCGRALEEGEVAWVKAGAPGSTICLECGKKREPRGVKPLEEYDHWRQFRVRRYHQWTAAQTRDLPHTQPADPSKEGTRRIEREAKS